MPHNALAPTQFGREISNDVSVSVGGQSFSGWQSLSITESLESIANEFSISLFDKFEGLRAAWPLKPGVDINVNIGRERVLTGHLENLQVDYTSERRGFAISGRSNSGDLVDSMHIGPSEYKNILLNTLAEELVKPFGIKVFVSVVPKIIDKFAVKPGETIFEALDRAARAQGLLFIATRGGNIRLTKAGATELRFRASSSLEQDVNILSASATYDDSHRHDRYIVKAQTIGLEGFSGLDAAQAEGEAQDSGITRHRPLIMIAESKADSGKAQTRAQWEASTRLAKAIRVSVLVPGWLQQDGSLWGANQIVNFKSAFLGLNRKLLIVNVTRTQGAERVQETTLTLTDPQAYKTEPVVNQKNSDDIFADLGSEF